MSFTRKADFLIPGLLKAKASFAAGKAKQMMGSGNPLTGSDIRKPASTNCSLCGRWHRPGTVCPSTTKSAPMITKGSKVYHHEVQRGNPYRSEGSNTFGKQPGGQQGKAARVDCQDALSLLQQAGFASSADDMCGEDVPMPPQPGPEVNVEPERAPMPGSLTSDSMLMWQPEPEEEKTAEEFAEDLQAGSQYLQNQDAKYLQALRQWQAKYGG